MIAQCYNKGCQQKFDPSTNTEQSCTYHPGEPVFHDALKGWSCCRKRSTDFTEFLNIPGCTTGLHNDVKPAVPVKPDPALSDDKVQEVVVRLPKPKNTTPVERPSETDIKIALQTTVLPSIKTALEREMDKINIEKIENDKCDGDIKVGTSCHNTGCNKSYNGESSVTETCHYHTGSPVFHEGMKFWSCCQRRTLDFTAFLQQEGCSQGSHLWVKNKTANGTKPCRFDWHQTASHVTISIYSKNPVPDKCRFTANRVVCEVDITFEAGKSCYRENFILNGIIDPVRSDVKLMGTKVEINLRKAEPSTWSSLCYPSSIENGQ